MPIKVKDHEKCKAWEQRRRDRLNDAFNNLSQLLPHYDPAKILPKLEILEKSTEFVKELRLSNSRLLSNQAENDEKCRLIKELQDEVNKLILRVKQLTVLLRKANITIPVGPEIKSLGSKRLKWSGKLKACDLENAVITKINPISNGTEVQNTTSPMKGADAVVSVPSEITSSKSASPTNSCSKTASPSSKGESSSLTNAPSIIIPLKEVNTSKSISSNNATPSTLTVTSPSISSPQKSTHNTSSTLPGSIITSSTITSPMKIISSTEPILTTSSTAPIQLPLQTFIIAPCPITGAPTAIPQAQLFTTRFALPAPLLPKPLDGIPLQKIPIKSVLKPIPKVIKRRRRRKKNEVAKEVEKPSKTSPQSSSTKEIQIENSGKEASPIPPTLPAATETSSNQTEETKKIEEIQEKTNSDEKKSDENICNETEKPSPPEVEKPPLIDLEIEFEERAKGKDTKEKEDEPPVVDIPVLRILDSKENDDVRNEEDILSKVVISDSRVVAEETGEQEKIMCITLDDDVMEAEVAPAPSVPEIVQLEPPQKEKVSEQKLDNPVINNVEVNPVEKEVDESISKPKSPAKTVEKEQASKENVAESSSSIVTIEESEVQNQSNKVVVELEVNQMAEEAVTVPVETAVEPNQRENDITDMDVDTTSKEASVSISASTSVTPTINIFSSAPTPISQATPIPSTVDQINAIDLPEYPSEPRIHLVPSSPQKIAKESSLKVPLPATPSTSSQSTLNTPQKQNKTNSDQNESETTTDKISECIARSIDLIDANDTELMELGEHWEAPGGSRSPVSPTQLFLNIFPLLPRDSSESQQPHQPHSSQQQPPISGTSSRCRSSFFIDAMLPDDHSTSSGVVHENLELIATPSSQTPCLALTPSQYTTPTSSQQPSSPFSFSNNYYWTPAASTCNFDSLDYRPSSSTQQLVSSSSSTSIFSSLPTSTPSITTVATSVPCVTTTKTSTPSKASTATFSSSGTSKSTPVSSSRSSKTTKVSQNTPVTSAPESKSMPFRHEVVSISSSASRSGSKGIVSSTTTVSSSSNTTLNVTWTLTTPTQSSSSSSHHHQPQAPSSQIAQFTPSSTCSLFDALTPMDASFFRPLMNALESNDFRALEFSNPSILPHAPPPPLPALIPPPSKSLYPQKNVGLPALGQIEPMESESSTIPVFENAVTQPLHFSHTPEKSKKQREQEPSPIKSSFTSKNHQETKSKSSGKQKSEKQSSRAGKSSRTQPYVVPSSTSTAPPLQVEADKSSSSQHQQTIHNRNSQPQQEKSIFHADYHNYHFSRKSTNSGTELQPQNLFAPSSAGSMGSNIFTPTSYGRAPSSTLAATQNASHSTECQTQKQPTSTKSTKSSKSREEKSPRPKGKSSQTQQQTTSQPHIHSNVIPLHLPQQSSNSSRVASNDHHATPQQPTALHSHAKSQNKTQPLADAASSSTSTNAIPQDLQFHHPDSFQQLFTDFHSHSQHEPQTSNNYQAQITHHHHPHHHHHHHHPYYIGDIASTFDSFPTHSHPPHNPNSQNPAQSFHDQTAPHQTHGGHVQHSFLQPPTSSHTGQAPGSSGKSSSATSFNNSNQQQQPRGHQQNNFALPTPSQRHQYPASSHLQNTSDNFAFIQQQPQQQPQAQPSTSQDHSHQTRTSQPPQRQEQLATHHHHQHHQQSHNVQQQQQPHQQRPLQPHRSATSSSSKSSKQQQHNDHPPSALSHSTQPPPTHHPHGHIHTHHQVPPATIQPEVQHKPQTQHQPPPQQMSRPSSSRTVNWMTDTAYRTNPTSRAPAATSTHPSPHKQQQRQQNNPFSVSKLVGNTSAKTQANSSTSHGTSGGSSQSKSKAKASTTTEPVGHGHSQSQNQSNYCAEALIRKDPSATDWSDFNFANYPSSSHHQHHHHSNPQPQQSTNASGITSGDFPNFSSQYHNYHHESGAATHSHPSGQYPQVDNSSQIQHFHHPPTQALNTPSYHSSQQHHNNLTHSSQSNQICYQNTTPMHFQQSSSSQSQSQQHPQLHTYHHQPHHGHHHTSSTSSVSNFNLSSIFPEINDKRSNNNNSSTTTQNQGSGGPSQGNNSNNQAPGTVTGSGSRGPSISSRTSTGVAGGGNMCNFQHHPGFTNNSSSNSGNSNNNNNNIHH